MGFCESTTCAFFRLVGQRPETIQKLAATSESKFCYLIIATKQHLFFPKKKMGIYLISYGYRNSQLNLINNLFCYLSRLSSRFMPKYTLRLYRPMFYNFYGGDEMITNFMTELFLCLYILCIVIYKD